MKQSNQSDILVVNGRRSLAGLPGIPGDKSIAQRALLMAAASNGESQLNNLPFSGDVRSTAAAMQALGVKLEWNDSSATVYGTGSVDEPTHALNMGNSGTGFRLMLGLLSGYDITAVLDGDDSLVARPMDRVIQPLSHMGAEFRARSNDRLPPVMVRGGGLRGGSHAISVPSAQVSGAVALAALRASGPTEIREPVPLRRHTEDLIHLFGGHVDRDGLNLTVYPSSLNGAVVDVPADVSQAAFWIVGAVCSPGSDIQLPPLTQDAERTGFIRVLERMGAEVAEIAEGRVRHVGSLCPTVVPAIEIPSLIDEIPALAVAAAVAVGTSVFQGVGELRLKESDRVEGIIQLLGAFGVPARVIGEDLVIEGTGYLSEASSVVAHGDHRIAMAGAIAALLAEGQSVIEGWSATHSSYPTFAEELGRLAGNG